MKPAQPQDEIEDFKGSLIQHGRNNNRIYLMQCSALPDRDLPGGLIRLAREKGYSKIFAKVPQSVSDLFSMSGFIQEARIPGFYRTDESALFMAWYLDAARKEEKDAMEIEKILSMTLKKRVKESLPGLDSRFAVRRCREEDLDDMIQLYRQIFDSYPFPIHDPEYLLKMMQSDEIEYFCMDSGGEIAAVSSAEIDNKNSNAEMTDFATAPAYRSRNFARHLLAEMESSLKEKKIKTVYTIARALSPGINMVFRQSGYHYSGRLKNNTNISGKIESMNVWYKHLDR
ncbi:putative beta-lysine N-acetyltransferase [Desulfospira joergensenii]|uniref:putative beta-lysine N-acetyltransferase n=1 Tax=Desulfospira joergensenii TaxID=53329 RepID=UPI0003B434C5|nr:putative beta-lysine N-acetyltransferase [Desulfospira joergensenii]